MKESNYKEETKRFFVFIANVINFVSLLGIWYAMWMRNYAAITARPFGYKGNWLVLAVYGFLLFLLTNMYGGYRVGYHRQADLFFSAVLALLFTNGISYVQICLLGARIMPLKPVLLTTVLGTLVLGVWAWAAQKLYQRFFPPYRMLMVYDGRTTAYALIEKMMSRDDKYSICEAVDIHEGLEYIFQRMEEYEAIILSDISSHERNRLLKYGYKMKKRVYMTPKISDIIIRGSHEIELFDSPLLLSESQGLTLFQRFIKRIMDLLIAIIGLVVLSPFMLLIALAIKLEDGGPVFYKQERMTRDRKVFEIYKFRSMIVGADKRPATDDDDRITKVGKVIRTIRFDELPQLINILKGEMSFVGPRPEHLDHVKAYEENIPEFSFRLNVKTGLTGYAQVYGKYNTTAYDKLKMDLQYIENYSVFLDIKIIFMTIQVLFKRESTEGLEDSSKALTNKPKGGEEH